MAVWHDYCLFSNRFCPLEDLSIKVEVHGLNAKKGDFKRSKNHSIPVMRMFYSEIQLPVPVLPSGQPDSITGPPDDVAKTVWRGSEHLVAGAGTQAASMPEDPHKVTVQIM